MPRPSERENDLVRLYDIHNAAKSALSHAGKMSIVRFITDRKSIAAVEREMEIVGEAAKHLSKKIITENPSLHWRGIKAMRDVLAHKYGIVDPRILWTTLRGDYPGLVVFVRRIISKLTLNG